MDWELIDVYDDVHADPRDDRWLLIYRVPEEHTPGGVHSVSMPKNMLTDWAATYGYDLDDPDDADAAWDHLLHRPYQVAVAHIEGRTHEAMANPYEMSPQAARALARDQVAEVKKRGRIVERPAKTLSSRHLAGAVQSEGILGMVKRDMLARADAGQARELAARKAALRAHAQERMMDLALRMNASHT